MPNASTIQRATVKPRELNQGGTSTSAIVYTSDGTIAVAIPLDRGAFSIGSTVATTVQSRFQVHAWGRCSGTSTNYTSALLFGTSSSSTSTLETSTTTAAPVTGGTWWMKAELAYDYNAKILNGVVSSQVSSAAVNVFAVIDAVPTPDQTSDYYFFISGTFSSGAAANLAYLDGFEINAL